MQGRSRELGQRRRVGVRWDLAPVAGLGDEIGQERICAADAYLYTVLNWTVPTRVDLAAWPPIKSYHEYQQTRPSIAKAFLEELALYKAELARHKAA